MSSTHETVLENAGPVIDALVDPENISDMGFCLLFVTVVYKLIRHYGTDKSQKRSGWIVTLIGSTYFSALSLRLAWSIFAPSGELYHLSWTELQAVDFLYSDTRISRFTVRAFLAVFAVDAVLMSPFGEYPIIGDAQVCPQLRHICLLMHICSP